MGFYLGAIASIVKSEQFPAIQEQLRAISCISAQRNSD